MYGKVKIIKVKIFMFGNGGFEVNGNLFFKHWKIVAIICGLVLLIIVFVIFGLEKKNESDFRVVIENYDRGETPIGYKDVIQSNIANILVKNGILISANTVDAVIRDGTYNVTVKNDYITRSKFIVDVDSLHYSFEVTVTWPDSIGNKVPEDPDVVIECPEYLDVIYTDTKCIAQEPYQQIKRYLPHYEYLENGLKYGVSLQKYNERFYLALEAKSCGDKMIEEEVMDSTKRWIKSIYMDPNDLEMMFFDICKR